MRQNKILLDVGTNELELMEIGAGGNRYGINVAKIREIVPLRGRAVTQLPDSPAAVIGVMHLRDEPVPLVDLCEVLRTESERPDQPIAVICEVNQHICGVRVDTVAQIHRVSWTAMRPLGYLDRFNTPLVGSVQLDEEPVGVLDIEAIVASVLPSSSLLASANQERSYDKPVDRASKTVWLADDSRTVRKVLRRHLEEAGYGALHEFGDGGSAFDALVLSASGEGERPDLLVTDIEMPRLDGMTLCKQIKEHEHLRDLPVVMFSSLVHREFAEKCRRVGANAWLSKPELGRLVDTVDVLLFGDPKAQGEQAVVDDAVREALARIGVSTVA